MHCNSKENGNGPTLKIRRGVSAKFNRNTPSGQGFYKSKTLFFIAIHYHSIYPMAFQVTLLLSCFLRCFATNGNDPP